MMVLEICSLLIVFENNFESGIDFTVHLYCGFQHHEKVGVGEYNCFIRLVDVWILLDCCGRPNTAARFPSALLVNPVAKVFLSLLLLMIIGTSKSSMRC